MKHLSQITVLMDVSNVKLSWGESSQHIWSKKETVFVHKIEYTPELAENSPLIGQYFSWKSI